MKKRKSILISIFLLLGITFFYFSLKKYEIPDNKELTKRINYLERAICKQSEINSLSIQNPEFVLFSYAFSAYSATNLALKDNIFKEKAIDLIKISIEKTLQVNVYNWYNIDFDSFTQNSEYSVLYLGHLNLMIGCYRLLSDSQEFNSLNDRISKNLFERYEKSNFLNLESYPSQIWLADNSVAIASLKLHEHNTQSGFGSICKKWVDFVKKNYLDPKTSVLCSKIDVETGEVLEEPRGSMLGWSIMFIYQFDEDFAINLYQNYKKHFSNNFLIFRLFKERYNNSETQTGDIDSGEILVGYSIPANEFAFFCAVAANDLRTAKRIERLINFGTKIIDKDNEIKYKIRFVDYNFSPMQEALVLFSMTATKWVN